MKLDLQKLGKDRDWIVDALKAEGVTGLFAGYQNIHLLPIFRNRIAYGVHGFSMERAPVWRERGCLRSWLVSSG